MHSLAGGSRVQPWEHGIAFLSMFSVAMTSAVSHVLPHFYNNLTQFLEETLLPLMLNLKKFRRASKNMLSLIAAKQWMPNHQGGRYWSLLEVLPPCQGPSVHAPFLCTHCLHPSPRGCSFQTAVLRPLSFSFILAQSLSINLFLPG